MKRVFVRTLVIVAITTPLWLSGLQSQRAGAEVASESQVKAAFLYRFTSYVQWPTSSAGTAPVTIAVLGEDAVASELMKLVQSKRSQGRQVRVELIAAISEGLNAHLVYISPAYRGELQEALGALGERPILSVTDMPDALQAGAVINFMTADRRVRFEVSVPAARRAGLHVSSELLAVAARVISAHLSKPANCDPGFVRPQTCFERFAPA